MRSRSLTGCALALVCLAPAGAAAGTWRSPQTLSTGPAAGTPTLGFDALGGALATWATRSGAGRRSASRPPSAAEFGPDRAAPNIGEEVVEGAPPAPVV